MSAKNLHHTLASLASQLRSLGLQRGDIVIFHSSLKAIGWVEPGAEAVVEAFLEVVGPEGTIVAPTSVPALRGIRPRFDVTRSPSEVGKLTEIVRNWPHAKRSNHPTNSVAAIGRLAEELTATHGTAWGPNSPWGRKALGFGSPWDQLRALDAWVLLIGVDFSRCTLLHHAQVQYVARHEGVTKETPWPYFDFRGMGQQLELEGLVRRGTLGNASCLLARAGALVTRTLAILEQDPQKWFGARPAMAAWLHARAEVEARGRPKATTFTVDISPPSPPRKVARPLHARGLLLDHPTGGRVALVVCDHGGFHHDEAKVVRRALAAAADVPVEAILLAATHDHSAYHHHTIPDYAYVSFVADQVANAAREALPRLEPVRAGWTAVPAPGIRQNRTVYLRGGLAYTESWLIPSTWHVKPEDMMRRGPADDDLRLLVIERLDGTSLAICADFSCQALTGMNDPCLHDDFFGVAMESVEHAMGGGVTVLCTPGSEGDQNPTAMTGLGDDLDLAYALGVGRRLAGYILAGCQTVPTHDLFDVGAGHVLTEVLARADWRAAAAGTTHPELQAIVRTGLAPAEVCALAVGDYALVGIPAELFTAPAQRIRAHSPFAQTSVTSLVNGNLMYVAESEAFFEGSAIHGVELDSAAMAQPGTDRVLSDAALQALRAAKAVQQDRRPQAARR